MTIYVVYRVAVEGGEVFSVRPQHIVRGADPIVDEVCAVGTTLDSVRRQIPLQNDVRIGPDASDDPSIVESWF